ncbi:hypothetical protein CALCODRAFT_500798 [Calocera cornea HHB12733]|uniref:glutathione transferase n=1 Tax=Calocera cornea HHB12733 TaxID=1353952 RepID=A0A165DXN2_9BASI|nr:hypothetical protein CALCODRAFT_500798 [Calocera cornea HHB12733]
MSTQEQTAPAPEGNPLAPDLATGPVHSEPVAAPSENVGEEATAGATAAAAAGIAAATESAVAGDVSTDPAAAAEKKIVLHHLDDSRSQRVLWLLEELGVPYEIKYYKRLPSKTAPPELKKIHPLGKSPIITDGPITLAESGAIVEYLIAKYGKGRFVPTEEGWVDNLYYNHYSEGTIQPILVMGLIFTLIPQRSPFLIRPITLAICKNVLNVLVDPQVKANAAMIEAHLAKSPSGWFAGGPEPTSADFLMSFACETLIARGGNSAGEKTKAFVSMVHGRDAYKRGLEKGGSYAYA